MNNMDCSFPLVSCVIVSYGKVNFLYEAIASVLSQSYPNIELLVSDDGSANFPKNDIEKFISENASKNIKRFVVNWNSENLGAVKNANSMLSIAKGDYIIDLDGDDVFFDNRVIERIVDRFIKTKSLVICCGRMVCSNEDLSFINVIPNKEELRKIKRLNTSEKLLDSFSTWRFYSYSGCALYFSRELIDTLGLFDEKYRLWGDGPYLLKMVKNDIRIENAFDIVSIKYRLGGMSTSKNNNSKTAEYWKNDCDRFLREIIIPYCKKSKSPRSLLRRHGFLFQYYWDQPISKKDRIILMMKYPIQGIKYVLNRIKGNRT